jgi:heme oxygenase (biliverdin-IX-beta and delta-forming)
MSEHEVVAAGSEFTEPLRTIRQATSHCHQPLESAINWRIAFSSLEHYRALLYAFARVVVPLESRLPTFLSELPPGYDPKLRSELLEHDLSTIAELTGIKPSGSVLTGCAVDDLHQTSEVDLDFIQNESTAIGALYVIEGSSLGGQILSRQLETNLSLTPTRGGAYFAGYGTATAQRWKSFCRWANQRLTDLAGTECAAEAAQKTFNCFGRAVTGLAHE